MALARSVCRLPAAYSVLSDMHSFPRFFCVVFLSLALLVTQYIGLAHGFSHLGTASIQQAITQSDTSDSQHAALHVCAACVAFSGLHAAPPVVDAVFPMVFAHAITVGFAVLPAPTFPAPAAFRSRAPPTLPV